MYLYLYTEVIKLFERPKSPIDGEDNDNHYKPVWIWSAFPPPRCKDCVPRDTRKRTPRRACSARLWAPTPLSSGTFLNYFEWHIFKLWVALFKLWFLILAPCWEDCRHRTIVSWRKVQPSKGRGELELRCHQQFDLVMIDNIHAGNNHT